VRQGHGDYYNCTQADSNAEWKRDADQTKLSLERWRYHSEKFADCAMSQKFEQSIDEKVCECAPR
jgi:hypothetical protein